MRRTMVSNLLFCSPRQQESAGRAEDAAAQYEAAVLEDPDDYAALQSYLDCLLPRSRGPDAGLGSARRAIVPGIEGLCALMAAARVDENGWHADAPPQVRTHSKPVQTLHRASITVMHIRESTGADANLSL